MAKETVTYPDEAPPEYSVTEEAQPRSSTPTVGPKWWWRKRVWTLGILLVLFALIFGSVFGTQQARSDSQSNVANDRSDAQNGGPSIVVYPSPTTRYPYDSYVSTTYRPYNWITTTLPGGSVISTAFYYTYTRTQDPYPYPTPGPILQAQGKVPRDLSVAVGAPDMAIWDLRSGGRLFLTEIDHGWQVYQDRQFLVAPVTVRTSETTRTAVSVDAVSGRIIYMHYHDGQWHDWQELEFGAQFLRRPAVISRAEGRVDVINADNEGHVWIVSYDGSSWSEWTELGTEISSDVSATTWSEHRIDVFAKNGETIMHKAWESESGWPVDWESLGEPFQGQFSEPDDFTSSPLAVSWLEGDAGVIDVVMMKGGSRHKLFRDGAWSDWLVMPASHEGLEFPDTASIVKGRAMDGQPAAHLISRGTDNCVHYINHNGTAWERWTYLWCNQDEVDNNLYYPTQFLPTAMTVHDTGNLELIVRDIKGNVLRQLLDSPVDTYRSWSNTDWASLGQPAIGD